MDDVLYESLSRYFKVLSHLGYRRYDDVYKLIFLAAVEEFVYHDFYGQITEDDYRKIERALYCVLGSTCLIPYPAFCKNKKTMDKLSLGTVTQLVNRIKAAEKNIEDIKKTKVVKVNGSKKIIIPDIKFG